MVVSPKAYQMNEDEKRCCPEEGVRSTLPPHPSGINLDRVSRVLSSNRVRHQLQFQRKTQTPNNHGVTSLSRPHANGGRLPLRNGNGDGCASTATGEPESPLCEFPAIRPHQALPFSDSVLNPLNLLKLILHFQGPTAALRPPHRAPLPLWLALLLKRQRRANILPLPWLLPLSLERILKHETETSPLAFSPLPPHPYPITSRISPTDHISPPFLPSSTADAPPDYLPYH